jgi:thiol-disulfide isomerase/thioredoxin
MCVFLSSAPAWAGRPPLAPGSLVPAFSLPTRNGTVAVDSLRGRVVLLDFWASWCGPCRQSFPWMAELRERLAPRGLEIVAVDLDKNREQADAFLDRYPAAFTVAFDPKGATAQAYGVRAMPTSLLIGRDGKVVQIHAGFDPRTAASFAHEIEEECAR